MAVFGAKPLLGNPIPNIDMIKICSMAAQLPAR